MKIMLRENKTQKWELVESNQYALEKELQDLLATSPEVISMDEIRPGSGPLVAAIREFNKENGYFDILAFTLRGDIVIIECKLANNGDTKRKVIGQIMEYASNLWGSTYEKLDQLIQEKNNQSLVDFVSSNTTEPGLWNEDVFRLNIKNSLANGSFILMIVVDEFNESLQKIIRYINSAGTPSFSLVALEIPRYQKNNIEMLIPHLFGLPQVMQTTQSIRGAKWNEESFFEELAINYPNNVTIAQRILEWAKNKKELYIWWGEGKTMGSFFPVFLHKKIHYQLFGIWTYGKIELQFQWYAQKEAFIDIRKRETILEMLNQINGVSIQATSLSSRPSFQIDLLNTPQQIEKFFDVFDWMIDQIKVS